MRHAISWGGKYPLDILGGMECSPWTLNRAGTAEDLGQSPHAEGLPCDVDGGVYPWGDPARSGIME